VRQFKRQLRLKISPLGKDPLIGVTLKMNPTIYQTLYWKELIEDSFGHKSLYLLAKNSNQIVDILPMFLIAKPILGKKLISTPYEACYGGYTSDSLETRKALAKTAIHLAEKIGVKYLEIRNFKRLNELEEMGFITRNPFIYSIVPLRYTEENWKMLSKNHRRNVRLAQKRGVIVEKAIQLDQIKVFYCILVENYKNFGTPIFPWKFLENIWKYLASKGLATLLLAKHNGQIIGGHLLLHSHDTLISKYSACRRQFLKLYPFYALYWEAIRVGIEKNLSFFNLGATHKENIGLMEFKTRWGAENYPVYFYYYPVKGKIPKLESYFNSFSLAKALWRRIPSNPIASFIGYKIAEWIC